MARNIPMVFRRSLTFRTVTTPMPATPTINPKARYPSNNDKMARTRD